MSQSLLIPEYNSDEESPQINEIKIINYDELVIDKLKFKNKYNSKLEFLEFISLTCNNIEKLKFIDLFITENFPSIFEDVNLTFEFETSFTDNIILADSFKIITDPNMFLQSYEYVIKSDNVLKNRNTESKIFRLKEDFKDANFGLIEFLHKPEKISEIFNSKSYYVSDCKSTIKQTMNAEYKTIKTDSLTNSILKAISPILNKIKISLFKDSDNPVYQVLFFMNDNRSKAEFITKNKYKKN